MLRECSRCGCRFESEQLKMGDLLNMCIECNKSYNLGEKR